MEIAPNIHQIPVIFFGNRSVYVHLLIGSEASMLVDTACAGSPKEVILPYMEKIGFDPKELTYILVSHSDLDHQGGNQPMKEASPQALVMCHNLDRPWIESTEALISGRYMQFDEDHGFVTSEDDKALYRAETLSTPIDITLEGSETFRLSPDWSVEVVHTPGHTWGHLAVYDPSSKTLIAGEAAIGTAILDVDWNGALPPTYCYVDTYLSTIDRLASMDIESYSGAHWPLKKGKEVAEILRESRNYCLQNERLLLELAQEGAFTLKEAIAKLAPKVSSWPEAADSLLMFPFAGNLQRLVQRSQLVEGRNNDNRITWRLP